jgi:uncharacterized membrane protein
MKRILLLPGAVLLLAALGGCEKSEPVVSFSADVQPILEKRCVSCHQLGQPGYLASELQLGSYAEVMDGTRYGPVVIPGDPMNSVLIMLVEGRADPSLKMPHGDVRPPTSDEMMTLRLWVEQGAQNN